MKGLIDLHCHTTASDGSCSPSAFVRKAAKAGCSVVAITDHDTVGGVQEAIRAGEKHKVRVIPGIEMTAEFPGANLHILGYGISLENVALNKALKGCYSERMARLKSAVKILKKAGVIITVESVLSFAAGAPPVKPHIAAALVAAGYAKTIAEAVAKYLSRGGPGYVSRVHLPAETIIALIRGAGGVPVIAHPYSTKLTGRDLTRFLKQMAAKGVAGAEVYYSKHTRAMTKDLRDTSKKLNLLQTGGSDWHGTVKPGISLGTGLGTLKVPQRVVRSLDEALAAAA